MESSSHNSSKRSFSEEDANISTFRRRNKILILVFLFLIISLTLITAALIIELVRIHQTSHKPVEIPPIQEFCSLSDQELCLRTLNPIVNNRFISDPNQIFTISLQTAANDLQHTISLNLSSSAFSSCSKSLRVGLDHIRDPLATMRVNPFVKSLSKEQRGEMMNRIMAAEEDVMSCMNDLANDESAAVDAVAAKLLLVKVYLNSAQDFLIEYPKVLHIHTGEIYVVDRGIIFENLFAICMCGLQVLFMFGMFCALYRIR